MAKSGWFLESRRHALASKGIATGRKVNPPMPVPVPKREPNPNFSAGTILQQLGGNKFIAMTGAKDFVKDDKEQMIAFRIGRNSKSVNIVRIRLNSKDLYDMEFLMSRGANIYPQSTANDIYFDQLLLSPPNRLNQHIGFACL